MSDNPNSGECLSQRGRDVARAWAPESRTRLEILVDLCRGKSVLDIGCVDHPLSLIEAPDWLHGQLAAVAQRCVGVDTNREGIDKMRALGYSAVCSDLDTIVDAVAPATAFDVVVAGELIEHVASPQLLLERAKELLAPGGRLVVTTPNPYALHRVAAGRRRIVWENCDHVVYCFPAGMVEMAQRSGLELTRFSFIRDPKGRWDTKGVGRRLVEYAKDSVRHRMHSPHFVTEVLLPIPGPHRDPWVGETAVYVLEPA
jgi:SAM-dependent methyltransferase